MDIWKKDSSGQEEFKYGQHEWKLASKIAEECPSFLPDEEDEQVSDIHRSCYNCRYRKWNRHSFFCVKA